MSVLTLKKIKFGVILFYLALFVGLGLYDEKPDPELMQEMARPLPEVVEPGNAWIVFLGLSAPEGVSPYLCGAEKIRKLQDAVVTGKGFGGFLASSAGSKAELSFRGKMPSFDCTKNERILVYVSTHPAEINALLRDNKELLRRYESLRTYPRFTEPLDYGYFTPIPMFSPLRHAQRIKQLQLAKLATQGDCEGALAGIRDDAEFWRFIARNSKTLISKLISISALSFDLRFAAELGVYRPLTEREMEIVREILRPFENGEASMAGALQGEAHYMQRGMELSTWRDMKQWNPEKLFFKRNATSNRMFADFRELIRRANLSPRQFADEIKRYEANKSGVRPIGLPFLYNSGGEILAVIAVPNFAGYSEKGHSLEGVRRLSWLKVLSREEKVPPERMQQFLDTYSKDYGNPFTGAPMIWNSKKGSISFTGISGEKSTEVFL
jgi:hypothetical protein